MKTDKIIHAAVAGLMLASGTLQCAVAKNQPVKLAKPSPKQIDFADWEIGAFIHYNLNPFTGQQHGDGKEPPSMFNPTELNVDQWMQTAMDMGAEYAVLTARHEGGFCLWPSKTTDYTIANSPYKNGKGDLVREFVDACRRHGLKVGLYHTSSHDAHHHLGWYEGTVGWGKSRDALMDRADQEHPDVVEQYKKVQLDQMRELLTQYGPIDYMWSDHWNAKDRDGIWYAISKLVEELQPNMVFHGMDSWVPGNETGHVVYPMWNAIDTEDGTVYSRPAAAKGDTTESNNYGLLEGDVRQGSPAGKFWRVRECTTHLALYHGGWFWQPDRILKTYPRKHWEHLDLYYRTVGLGANAIINLPPDDRGLIPEDIAAVAKAFGDEIKKRFSHPVAETTRVLLGDVVELAWENPEEINTVVTMENIVNGQKVAEYTLEAFVDGAWHPLEPVNRLMAKKPYNNRPGYQTIGHKKIDRVKPVVTNRIRFRCLKSVAEPVEIRRLAVFRCDPIIRSSAGYPNLSGLSTVFEEAHGGMKIDMDYRDHELNLDGKVYKHGLLLCPVKSTKVGVAEFDLKPWPKAKGLTAIIGIEDMVGEKGSVEFVVEGRTGGEWTCLFKSPVLKGSDAAVELKVSFPEGMDMLRLKTTDGDDGVGADHALWADAQFTE